MRSQLLKRATRRMTGVMAMLLIGAGFIASDASAGIADTKHNLNGNMTVNNRTNSFTPDSATTTGNGEICVFCHTPHGSDTGAAVPLWNRSLGAKGGATYKTYNSLGTSSLDGTVAPVGSVSLACLSCHDGTQAMNVMINQPGSGGYNSGGDKWAGQWDGGSQTDGKLTGAASNGITLIGTDLTNDHPIGIQYAGGPKSGKTIPTTAGTGNYTKDLFRDEDFQPANTAKLNSMTVWWVDTERNGSGVITPNGTREKTDMQLYTRTETGYTGDQPFVECASCHDPHTTNVTFLRMADGNKNSQICLSCHIK